MQYNRLETKQGECVAHVCDPLYVLDLPNVDALRVGADVEPEYTAVHLLHLLLLLASLRLLGRVLFGVFLLANGGRPRSG